MTAEGVCYEGQWQNDKMNGEGVLKFPTGSVFEGEFVNNQFHGKGKYTWPNGAVYEGPFNENKWVQDGYLSQAGQNASFPRDMVKICVKN